MKTIKTLLEIPAKYKWITIDDDGLVTLWTKKPKQLISLKIWMLDDINVDQYVEPFKINPPKDWTKSIWRIEEYDEV